jgi:hypothetical protein
MGSIDALFRAASVPAVFFSLWVALALAEGVAEGLEVTETETAGLANDEVVSAVALGEASISGFGTDFLPEL